MKTQSNVLAETPAGGESAVTTQEPPVQAAAPLSLGEQLRKREEQRVAELRKRHQQALLKASTLDEYRTLVDRATTPNAGDVDAVAALLKELNLSASDLEADMAAIARARWLEPKLVSRADAEKAEAVLAADVEATKKVALDVIASAMEQVRPEVLAGEFALPHMVAQAMNVLFSFIPRAMHIEYGAKRDAIKRQAQSALFKRDSIVRRGQNYENELAQLRMKNPRVFAGLDAVKIDPAPSGS